MLSPYAGLTGPPPLVRCSSQTSSPATLTFAQSFPTMMALFSSSSHAPGIFLVSRPLYLLFLLLRKFLPPVISLISGLKCHVFRDDLPKCSIQNKVLFPQLSIPFFTLFIFLCDCYCHLTYYYEFAIDFLSQLEYKTHGTTNLLYSWLCPSALNSFWNVEAL